VGARGAVRVAVREVARVAARVAVVTVAASRAAAARAAASRAAASRAAASRRRGRRRQGQQWGDEGGGYMYEGGGATRVAATRPEGGGDKCSDVAKGYTCNPNQGRG